MRKILTTIGIIWIVGTSIFMAVVYESDIGWSRFPEFFIDDFLIGFLLIGLPGIAILVFIYVYEFLQKQKHRSKGTEFYAAEPIDKKLKSLHLDNRWIFLSYRRADSADIAGRVYDRLIEKFGSQAVFKDVDSIPFGLDFRTVINQMILQSRIFIAIIGPNWLGQIQDQAKRRIDDPTDFVRIEVSSALERAIPVIPLLVYGATLPHPNALPEDLKAIAYRNGTVIRPDPDFNHDISRVISDICELR